MGYTYKEFFISVNSLRHILSAGEYEAFLRQEVETKGGRLMSSISVGIALAVTNRYVLRLQAKQG